MNLSTFSSFHQMKPVKNSLKWKRPSHTKIMISFWKHPCNLSLICHTAFTGVYQTVTRCQSEQMLQRHANAKRVSLKYFIDTCRINTFSFRNEATPGRFYSYDCSGECWECNIISLIHMVCSAAIENAIYDSSSLNKTSRICSETSHERMTTLWKHCKPFLWSRSIAAHRKDDDERFFFLLLMNVISLWKWRFGGKLI